MNKLENIGEYDRRFLIERPEAAISPIGNARTKVWSSVVTLWGKYKFIPSKEVFEAAQQVASNKVEIQTRYWPNIDETMRITDVIYGGTYQISNVISEKREDRLVITGNKRDNNPQ